MKEKIREVIATVPRPSYEDLIDLLRSAPPREAIQHEGYWRWRRLVDDTLKRCDL